MQPELIIFDCDGTLADTEYMHQLAVIGALDACGFPGYTVEFGLQNFVGRGMAHVQKIVEEREGRKLSDDFLPLYVDLCEKQMAAGIKPLALATEALDTLSKDYKICVASNGEHKTVVHTIQAIGMMDYFGEDRIFTKHMVARGKPAPDLFLYAAEQMGFAPEKCIVIEDSIAGVTAGVAAHMKTIGITAVSHDPVQTAEDMKKVGVVDIYRSWPEIVTFIKALQG